MTETSGNDQKKYFSRTVDEVLETFSADPESGLSKAEVSKRREKYGENVLPKKDKTGPFKLFIKQFKDFLILILFIAAAVSIYAGQMANMWIILGVILFNATMGFIQEYRAEKAVESIKKMVKKKAGVLRDGETLTVKAHALVPGDILILEEGEAVQADARLIRTKNLQITESALTGEPEPVNKQTEKLKKDTELANRTNMTWKGTHVVKGSGTAVVVATGEDTELGKIASSLTKMKRSESNFRKKTRRLTKKMAAIAVATSIIVFCIGYFYRSFGFNEILLVTIATLVSSIPEGLPVVISIVLAIGANRMAKRNAIIREFTATEVLGSVSTILTDKTGTLTQSILTVKKLFNAGGKELSVSGQGHEIEGDISEEEEKLSADDDRPLLSKQLLIARFCNNATLHIGEEEKKEGGDGDSGSNGPTVKTSGDPTEVALKVLAKKAESIITADNTERLDDLPFNSEQRFRATLIGYNGTREMLVVGAPEKIMDLSEKWLTSEGPQPFESSEKETVQQKNDAWADEAMRVLAMAYKEMPEKTAEIDTEQVNGLVWTGLIGIIDPARPEAEEAVRACHEAGIRVIMVTGDHKRTAAAIAANVGILPEKEKQDGPVALSEKDLEELSDEEFEQSIRDVSVFARVSPNTKLRIAESLQNMGELIGMTGDGVNDAPALKKADVGIAMGIKGTDVAKDAAKIILSDDNFASIVNAVREGRIVFKNIKSTSYFLLTTNFASTSTLILALALGLPIPLTAVQILWVNIVTDGIMDVAKSTEPGHGEMMKRKPIKKNEKILTWDILPYLLIMAAVMVSLAILAFRHYLPEGTEKARTAAFLVIAMTQVFNVFNMRDIRQSVFSIGVFSNKWINIAFLASAALQFAVVEIPFLQKAFGFTGVSIVEFLVITAISTIVLWAGEVYKLIRRKYAS